MRRSEINRQIRETMEWLDSRCVCLPPFAFWKADEWAGKGHEYDEIRRNMLGWDVTDFGSGDFDKVGLFLFTIRNGNVKDERYAKPYAEKLLVSQVGQVTPTHYHWSKMEDIINRGGGTLVIQLWNADENDGLAGTDVNVRVDGCLRTVPAGGKVRLAPGESITLTPRLYHTFWAEGEKVMAWEVSMVNDDTADNRFYEPSERFMTIDEDEAAAYLLCNEYPEA